MRQKCLRPVGARWPVGAPRADAVAFIAAIDQVLGLAQVDSTVYNPVGDTTKAESADSYGYIGRGIFLLLNVLFFYGSGFMIFGRGFLAVYIVYCSGSRLQLHRDGRGRQWLHGQGLLRAPLCVHVGRGFYVCSG